MDKFNTWEYFGRTLRRIEVSANSNGFRQSQLNVAVNQVPVTATRISASGDTYSLYLPQHTILDPNYLNSLQLYTTPEGDVSINSIVLYIE